MPLGDLASSLEDQEFIRERWAPRCGDSDYLCLSDLRQALEEYKSAEPTRVLDYGCGGSPYRDLFPRAEYLRADFEGSQLDFEIIPGKPLAADAESVDLVISTQVLEHVLEPELFLSDCSRVLRPGGKLIVTTHGTFREHACPHDYHRWTAEGLRHAFEKAGFEKIVASKLTCGPRALLFLMEIHSQPIHKWSFFGFLIALWRNRVRAKRKMFHEWVDAKFPNCRIVPATLGSADLYIGLLVSGSKPQ